MLASVLLAIAVVLLVSWYIVFRMRRRRLYELADKLPGLPELPFIGHLHRFIGDTEVIFTKLMEVDHFAINHGGIAKIWIGHCLFCLLTDPVDIEYVLKTCLEKDEIARFVRKVLGNGIVFAPASIWRRRRKIMATGFSTKTFDLLFEVFRENSHTLAEQLQSKVGAGEFDLCPFVNTYTLDSILETVCGVDKTDRSSDYEETVSSISQWLHLVSERIFRPWLHPDWLYRFSSSYKAFHESCSFFNSFTDKVIKHTRMELEKIELQKMKTEDDRVYESRTWTSFLRLLIQQSSKSQPYSDLELREEVASVIAAATDTSAVSTCFTLLLLGRHQDVQKKVYQELVEVLGTERPLVKEDLSRLCYLDQVIKESLRLYPPVPAIGRQAVTETTLPSGRVLPAGCGIPISIWGVHRNPAYWGADAELFRPERFSPERYNPQHACVYMPFSAGMRNCIGYQYGMVSMKTSLATILRKYRVRIAGDASARIRVKYEIMMKPVDGFKIVLDKRD